MSNPENEENKEPEDFESLLRNFLSGQGALDPEKLAQAAGLPVDPAMLQDLLNQITSAMQTGEDTQGGVNWKLAESQAKTIAAKSSQQVPEAVGKAIASAVATGSLWLDEATSISELTTQHKLLSRELWIADSIGLFKDLAQPVAERMGNALTENFQQNLPEEFSGFMESASGLMKSAGSTMFAMQLGQALGNLSEEVLTGGDIGLPIFKEQRAAFVAQNVAKFVADLEEEPDQVYLFLAVRELAHARLFKHSKWLRDYVVNLITSYAREITIDNSKIVEMTEDFDPSDIGELQKALETGAFIADQTDAQKQALETIETTLALIEGWVDQVTEVACVRLPRAGAIAEAIRRKRATGGPAEKTFGTLIGLELRPRKLREASLMWKKLTESIGPEMRDSLWSHPDLIPTAEDILDPTRIIRQAKESSLPDDFDQALKDFLDDKE